MRLTAVRVQNFRAFEDSGVLETGAVNVLLGPNNAGKSSLLRALCLLQHGFPLSGSDVRLGAPEAVLSLTMMDPPPVAFANQRFEAVTLAVHLAPGGQLSFTGSVVDGGGLGWNRFPATEPHNLIYPFFSGRKTAGYQQTVNLAATSAVGPDLRYLPAKLTRLSNPDFPAHSGYREASERILGFVVTAIPAPNGMQAGIYVSPTTTIPLEAMGEGVANIVGLIADLCVAEDKVFLLEEPENDIHLAALKALLEVVLESAEQNQFIVTTHSNIVARYLGATDDSNVYYVDSEKTLPPTARTRRVGNDPMERMAVLTELGYELYDFDLWDGWLILEESSAERIIRDYLVPWFAPKLRRVRTLAAGGTTKVGPTFEDFNRLFRFTHLEPRYRNRAWVVADGDTEGGGVPGSGETRWA